MAQLIKACVFRSEGRRFNPRRDRKVVIGKNLRSGGLTTTVIPCIWEEYTNADPPIIQALSTSKNEIILSHYVTKFSLAFLPLMSRSTVNIIGHIKSVQYISINVPMSEKKHHTTIIMTEAEFEDMGTKTLQGMSKVRELTRRKSRMKASTQPQSKRYPYGGMENHQ